MLFLLKRSAASGLVGLAILTALGLGLRGLVGGPPLIESPVQLLLGVIVFAAMLCSDGALHGCFLFLFGPPYRRRCMELVQVFRGQSAGAMLAGAAMAGLGEELVFRGLSTNPLFLAASAILFGLLHHVRRSLWPFTLWAILQGIWLGAALVLTGALGTTLVAHFLHDLAGFTIFAYLNRRAEAERARPARSPEARG